MKKTPIVSFDFDSTLSRKDVQDYALELITAGVDVWVVTSRYDDLHGHLWAPGATNDGLFSVTDSLGIPRHKIRFTNTQSKSIYLANTHVLWHLDDDTIELLEMIENPQVFAKGINVENDQWKEDCNKLLNNYKN